MPINQISKGVYVISAPDVKRYKDTAAGEYTSVFTKQRADQWELAQKQALMEYKDRDLKYQAEVELYKDRIKNLENAKADLISGIESRNANRINDALKKTAELELQAKSTTARLKAERQAEQASTVYLMPGTTTTQAGGEFGTGREKVKSRVEEVIGGAMAEGAGDTAAVAASFKKGAIGAGLGTSLSPGESDLAGYQLYEGLVDSKVRGGQTREEAVANTARELVTSGNTDIVVSHKNVSEKKSPTGGGGFTTTTEREVEAMPRYPGLGAVSGVSAPSVGAYPGAEESKAGLAYEPTLEDAEKALKSINEMISGVQAPKLSDFDYITRAREIAAGRFGPTVGAQAPYVQRNVLDALLSASPEKRAELLERYRKESGAPAAVAPTDAAPAAPATEATIPPGRTPWRDAATGDEGYLLPGNIPVVTKKGTPPAPPAEPAATPALPMPITNQPAVQDFSGGQPPPSAIAPTPSVQNMIDLEALVGPDEASRLMAERNTVPVPEPPRLPDLKTPQADRTVAPLTDQRTFEAPPGAPAAGLGTAPPLPRATFDEPVQYSGTQGMPGPRLEAQKLLPTKKAVIKDTTARGYLVNRLMEADELLAQSSKFDRILKNTELGNTVKELWQINYASGKDFEVTWKELQNQYSLDPELMKKAHAIALALDKSALKKNKPPVIEEK